MFGCSLQIRISLGQHSFGHVILILFVNFCCIYLSAFGSRLFSCTSAPKLMTTQLISAGVGGGGVGAYLPYFLLVPLRTSAWKASGDVALCFFRSLFFVKEGRCATKDGLISLQRIFQ